MIRPALALFLIFIIPATRLPAQNIVPNGRFDQVNTCTEYHYPCAPKGWFYCSLRSHGNYGVTRISPDSFQHCLTMRTADRDLPTRQYWQTRLLCPLQSGSHYLIRLEVSASNIGPNLHDIGFYFTDRFLFTPYDTLLQPSSYLGFTDATVHDLGFGWFGLEKKFTATGNEPVLIIGNFSPETNKSILKKRGKRSVNITVTNICIQPLDAPICPDYQRTEDALFAITTRHSSIQFTTPIATPAPPSAPHIDTLRIPDIDFAFDSFHLIDSNLLDKYRPALKDISRILVAGYTDQVGSVAYNFQLSEKRAREIARLLSDHYHIDTTLITAEGRGISTQYNNDAANRRVEIYIFHSL